MGQQAPEDKVGDTGLDAGRYRTLWRSVAMAGVSTPVRQCRYLILDFINRFFGSCAYHRRSIGAPYQLTKEGDLTRRIWCYFLSKVNWGHMTCAIWKDVPSTAEE